MFDSQETLRHLQLGALDNGHVYCLDIDHGVPGCQVDGYGSIPIKIQFLGG